MGAYGRYLLESKHPICRVEVCIRPVVGLGDQYYGHASAETRAEVILNGEC
jgi:hypothetical protein